MNKSGKPKQALFFIMRVTLLHVFLAFSCISYSFAGTANGQEILDKKISLNLSSKELKTVLKMITTSAEVGFTYNSRILPENKRVTVVANDERLGDVLDKVFAPLGISYEAIGKQIVLKKRKNPITGQLLPDNMHAELFKPIIGSVVGIDGAPLSGVSVQVAGSSRGTVTDEKGHFHLEANNGDVLVFSFVGFQTTRLTISSSSEFSVTLLKSENSLNDVVITALGIKRESRSIGYSAQKITGSDITQASPPDLASGLMGKSAGLNITASNGVQGNSQRIVIRGNNSITGGNQPLLVIDGIQVQNDPVGGQQSTINAAPLNGTLTGGGTNDLVTPKDWGSFLNFLNSDDVQDVTVLKGATASALYGARGANGVILITTKRGGKRAGIGVDYNFSTLWSKTYRYQELQNSYGYGGANAMWSANLDFPTTSTGDKRYPGNYPWDGTPAGDAYESAGNIPGGYSTWDVFSWYGPGASWGHKLDGTEIVWWDGVKRKWDPQPDNRKAFFRTGNTSTHNVAFSGGGDFGSFRMGYTRQDNTAITKNSNYNQNNINLGANLNLSKKIKVDMSASYTNYTRLNVPDIANDQGWTNFMIYSMSRDYKPLEFSNYKNADGSKRDLIAASPFGYYPYQNNYNQNLFWHLFEQNQTLTRNQLLGSVKVSADATPWLNFTGRASINYAITNVESKYSPIDAAGTEGQYGMDYSRNQDVNLELFTTLHKESLFGSKVNGSLLIGNSTLKSRYYDNNAWNSGEPNATYGKSSTYPWSVPFRYYLSNTTNANGITPPVEVWNNYNLNSLFGIMDLSYDNYLFLQVTGRNDWSSTLPIKTSSYFFPSASLSFVFTEAIKGMQNISWLNYGKLKVSAAKSANGALPYQSTYTYNTSVIGNPLNATAPTAFGGVPVRSYQTVLPPAGFLVPQRNSSYEIGLEAGFLKNRLNFEFTYYQTHATSQIMQSYLPWSSGAQQVTFNTGELSNKGIELIIRATAVQTRNFRWDVSVNAAHNQNKVISLAEGITKYPLQDLWGSNGVQMYVKPGENYGTIYGYNYTYLNGKKVLQRVFDKSNPTQVVGTQYVTTTDPAPIGNATPKLTGGISNTFRYKNFSLYVLTDFKVGGQIFSADYGAAMAEGLAPETLKERNGGGLAYTYPDGTKANHGVILDGVFADGKPNTDVVHYMWKYAGQYEAWSNVPMPRANSIFTNSWGKLRELTFTYSIPDKLIKSTRFIQGMDISLVGRNLFYIFTTLPDHLNPEAINGIGNGQGVQWSEFPPTRDFGISVKVKL
jgi:iron complex outermembrane receptor protein